MIAALFACLALAAQEPDGEQWNSMLRSRMERGEDLIELRYRRDEHGVLEVASCEHGAVPFHVMFSADRLPRADTALVWGLGALFLVGDGEAGVLGAVDGERHLRRIGVDMTTVGLRQFLLTPVSSADAERARVEELDRVVAIDTLRRGGHRGVVAELIALAADGKTPPLLAARAKDVLGAFGRGKPLARARLAPESLLLPVAADVFVVVDHARLPDLRPLRELARRMAIESSYRVLRALRAPTPDDLYHGQLVADAVGEAPFELVRRIGDVRVDHSVLSLAVVAGEGGRPDLDFLLQATGSFDAERIAATCDTIAAATPGAVRCERRDGEVCIEAGADTVVVAPTTVVAHGKRMAGRARPDIASQLLVAGPAIRVVVPKASKAWAALLLGDVPRGAEGATIDVSFDGRCRVAATLTARDEDAAVSWKEWLEAKFANAARLRDRFSARDAAPGVQQIVDVLTGAKASVAGATVQVAMECPIDVLLGQPLVAAVLAEMRARMP